jgi:hypothetical protein
MNENEEKAYIQGSRAAWTQMLRACINNLGYSSSTNEDWIIEREGVISSLRILCQAFGDDDWDDTLDLQDIIEKHLADYLFAGKNS